MSNRMELIPKPLSQIVFSLRDRVLAIKKVYGSLSKYGYPIFQNEIEVYAIAYLMKEYGLSASEIAKETGIDRSTFYRLMRRIEEGKPIRIWKDGEFESIKVDYGKAKEVIEELISPKAKKWIKNPTESECIQSFIKNPVKMHKASKHGILYSKHDVVKTILYIRKLLDYIYRNRRKIREKYNIDLPNNPDLWNKEHEDIVYQVINDYVEEEFSDPQKRLYNKRTIMQMLKRIPKFREWFKGRIGAVKSVVVPKEATLYYEHYLKLKRLANESNNKELKAFYLIASLHIETGAREGWSSLERKGIKIWKVDLDSDIVNTSLIGIKWEHAIWGVNGELIGFKVYEEKTKKIWELRISWLDKELHEELKKVYEWASKKGIKSVVKSILLYYGINGRSSWSVNSFKNWYSKWCKKLRELLNLPWDMTPHRLRSAHISILAELRIPMELALQNTGFGVGWEDINTAMLFYLRFSKNLINDYLNEAEKIKARIMEKI
ncbi:MAG: hypothetical protein DRO40_06625 [Thermoprotei archaeon]|nr:MAG: hypothetical protein DRO40_06625 [Thermoprotei archaeon]